MLSLQESGGIDFQKIEHGKQQLGRSEEGQAGYALFYKIYLYSEMLAQYARTLKQLLSHGANALGDQ